MSTLGGMLSKAWGWIRTATGDDAYDRYIRHHRIAHPQSPPMSRSAFYADSQRRKWSGINRCC